MNTTILPLNSEVSKPPAEKVRSLLSTALVYVHSCKHIAEHLDYLLGELNCMIEAPPKTEEEARAYLVGLKEYVENLRVYVPVLPQDETEEED
jgi:hypothetical protein